MISLAMAQTHTPQNGAPRVAMERTNPANPSPGFRASLQSASLPEFIQIGGAAGGRVIYRIVSDGRAGYLYLEAGQVVHAHTHRAEGREAAFEILRWEQGTIEAWPGPWPRTTTFSASPQSLLLEAAYREDEGRRRGELIPLELHRKDPEFTSPETCRDAMTNPSFEDLICSPAVTDAVLVDRDGVVVVGKGTAQEDLGSVASYAAMLAELVGDALGLEGFVGLDARVGEQQCALRRSHRGLSLMLGERGTASSLPWEEQ